MGENSPREGLQDTRNMKTKTENFWGWANIRKLGERGLYIYFLIHRCCQSIPVPAPLLIIPIIMALYENVINNTADIVVAISHMVVGLCSVTNLPLASTYVCQRRAAMTSLSSAHLALPTERCTLGAEDELGVPPGFMPEWVFYVAFSWTRDKMSTGVWDSPSTSMLLGKGKKRGGERRHKSSKIICACVFFKHTHNALIYILASYSHLPRFPFTSHAVWIFP